jgi:hypothetical protein
MFRNKAFVFVITFCFALSAEAGVPLAAVSMGIGGGSGGATNTMPSDFFTVLSSTNTTSFFSLYTANQGGSSGNYSPFYKNGVLYQVTPGKTCTCYRTKFWDDVAGSRAQLVSATSTFAINASSLTGGVFQGGVAGNYVLNSQAAMAWTYYSDSYDFGSATFPGAQFSVPTGRLILSACVEH